MKSRFLLVLVPFLLLFSIFFSIFLYDLGNIHYCIPPHPYDIDIAVSLPFEFYPNLLISTYQAFFLKNCDLPIAELDSPLEPPVEPDTGEFRYGEQECHYTDTNGEQRSCIVSG